MKKNIWIILAIVIIAIGGVLWYSKNNSGVPTAMQTSSGSNRSTQADEMQLVSNLVINFGSQLRKVSLTAPKTQVIKAISSTYAGYASPDLIAAWIADPSKAPGRLTSSPWPDHIVLTSVTPSEGGGYSVQGNVAEYTSTGYTDEYPVSLGVQQVNGQWLITSYTDGLKR